MKVVLRSHSLWFTVLSIVFNVPITRVKRKLEILPPKKPAMRLEPAEQSKYWNRVAL